MGTCVKELHSVGGTGHTRYSTMDAIRKKMQSLKSETDGLYATIKKFEDAKAASDAISDQCDCDIRDYGKKAMDLKLTLMKLMTSFKRSPLHWKKGRRASKKLREISALSRRIMLMEEEAKKSETNLA